MKELLYYCNDGNSTSTTSNFEGHNCTSWRTNTTIIAKSLEWISLLLAKSLTISDSPVVQKLCLFRLLNGRGIILLDNSTTDNHSITTSTKGASKKKISSNQQKNVTNVIKGSPIFCCLLYITIL